MPSAATRPVFNVTDSGSASLTSPANAIGGTSMAAVRVWRCQARDSQRPIRQGGRQRTESRRSACRSASRSSCRWRSRSSGQPETCRRQFATLPDDQRGRAGCAVVLMRQDRQRAAAPAERPRVQRASRREEAIRGRQRDRAGVAPHRLRRISPACLQLIEVRRRTGHIDPRPRLCNHITRIARQRDRAARQDLAGVRHGGRRPDPDRRSERIRNRGARHIERRVRTEARPIGCRSARICRTGPSARTYRPNPH